MSCEPTALVTGAARGIGAATVRALVDAGYRVTAVDSCADDRPPPGVAYNLASADDLAALAVELGPNVLPIHADVRSKADLDAAVASTLEHFGRLDVVVAAAAVVVGGRPLWETPAEELSSALDVNVVGVWNTAAATLPALLASSDPTQSRFIAVASAAGERGLFNLAAYTASKHAVVGIVRALAADLTGTGVSTVAVSPGSTRTPMLRATADLYRVTPDELATHQRIRRLIEPEEIAHVVLTCCGPAGAVLNGSVVNADGGFEG